MVVLKYARQGGCHERLAQPDHIADDDAAPSVEVVCGDLHGSRLKVEQFVVEVFWYAKFRQAGSRFLRQMVRHFDVDLVGRDQLFARPAFLNNLAEFF